MDAILTPEGYRHHSSWGSVEPLTDLRQIQRQVKAAKRASELSGVPSVVLFAFSNLQDGRRYPLLSYETATFFSGDDTEGAAFDAAYKRIVMHIAGGGTAETAE